MEVEKYIPNSISVSAILGLIAGGDIAIPEIQRPFVWKKTQVRDLLDSLYKGYPTGYLIIWKNPDVRLKDGKMSAGKKILIDGQQRVTALMTAIAGIPVTLSNYKKDRIKIAFDPFQAFSEDQDAEIFAVQDSSHLKSKRWIPDVAEVFKSDFSVYSFITNYCNDNPDMKPETLDKIITRLRGIGNRMIGVIDLSEKLNIDIVTDIFIRINSKGTALSQGDFVMSKIAADENYGGNNLRKAIDYFAHLSKVPSFYERIKEDDKAFANTDYFKKIEWLKDEIEDVYDPDYDDVIRVAFMHKYPRAKLSDLVSLLSGRDFETREYKEEIIADTYTKLKDGVMDVFSEYNFKQFMIAIRSAGFISKKLVNSQMALDFAYTLYLILIQSHEVSTGEVKRLVQKWYVLSVLTGRYSSSPESGFARDIRLINEQGVVKTLHDIELATLSETFWNIAVVQNLMITSTNNPTYLIYLAAQVMMNDISLLSNNVLVRELIEGGDVHHIFPKEYLKANGYEKSQYNQEGNYAFLDTQVNKSIGKKAPNEYFSEAREQCETGIITIGSITDFNQLMENLRVNCVPEDVFDMDYTRYADFLEKRRIMMAQKIQKYYESL
ncbi:MAG: DUF262 domain-containing protein [Clostridia bacterium]|nr:DUF262 domain-containing protein [Clostridia bacterium]